MNSPLPSYLSLLCENEEELRYISGLLDQFDLAKTSGSFHLALFAYHLLFMTFVYQTIFKIKIWMPDRFNDALVQSPSEKRKKYQESSSVWDLSEFRESSIFELLNLLQSCEEEVVRCKNIIKYRNRGFGHATGVLVSEEEFGKKIEEYDQMASEIHLLTHNELAKIFDEYFKSLDPTLEQTKDDLEIYLIGPNRLSDKDLESLAAECLIGRTVPLEKRKQIFGILQDNFNMHIELLDFKPAQDK